jgi:glycosyltransferase involved in cell wall biosynthesis
MSLARARNDKCGVVFVAEELLGYAGNGLGTTTTFVAVALARMGHAVEVFFLGPAPAGPIEPEWRQLYEGAGISVRQITRGTTPVEPAHFARARDVEAALREDPPDVVIVQDLGAPAYTALRLRHLGLAFDKTSFVVLCHGTRQWITDVSRKARVLPGAHAVTVLERASIEMADVVVAPSSYIVDWMRGEGWRLPAQTLVIRHLSRTGATGEAAPAASRRSSAAIDRVAFFGRLEERKGIRPFVGALNLLEPELLQRLEVEFIGRPTPTWPIERVTELLSGRAAQALRHISFETTLDQHEALARLSRAGTLAVMPSFAEVFGNTVLECIDHEIPFVASNAAALRELVAPEDRERVLVEPTALGIADALRFALTNPDTVRTARRSFDDADSLRAWEHVLALPVASRRSGDQRADVEILVRSQRDPAGVDAEWVLLLDEDDDAEPELVETVVRAQQSSGADVVTCGIAVNGTVRLFPGEPGALGLLDNGYGTVALVRRSLLEPGRIDPAWPSLAKLSVGGARIVSVPSPLATTTRRPASLQTHPDQARAVLSHFEAALPHRLSFLAEFVMRSAARPPSQSPARGRNLVRRLIRRLTRTLTR